MRTFQDIRHSLGRKIFSATVLLAATTSVMAQDNKPQRGVFTNSFADNWEASFGLEGLSFYSSKEEGMNLSKSPFKSFRANFGAAATIGKWFTPEIGLRTKASGYWGKAFIGTTPEENAIRFFAIQEQAMFNIFNIIGGYDPTRRWELIPYGGVGFIRNCTHNENSIGAGFGIVNTYRLSNHMKLHFDLGLTFAGDNYKENGVDNVMGRYHWFSFEVGLAFNLGKQSWSRYRNRKSEKVRMTSIDRTYLDVVNDKKENVDFQSVIADSPVPEGMVLINRGHLRMGIEKQDSLWGIGTPIRDISVDDFWMDKTEITNAQYRAFIKDICDSIVAQRLEDPYYMGDENKVRESLYVTNPVTGEKLLDARQMVYVYEVYDYAESMKRKYRLDPKERILNTDIKVDEQEQIWISKDTAYVDKQGNIIRETINRPLSGPYDFLNTYIVNVYPDTTCWVNDFPNADNDMYARYYFSSPEYKDYPVVGVTWEQANAYCAWRTEQMKRRMGANYGNEQPFRLPTEAEWEYAARGRSQNEFPWNFDKAGDGKGMFFANFMPDDGNFTKDGNIITSRVGVYPSNTNGLYDMAGNVAEWTSTLYTAAGIEVMNNINPQLKYNAAIEDPYRLKRKSVRGGSWKDSESHIRSAWRSNEYQNQPRSYIGFRCVRSIATTPSEKTVIVVSKKKTK